MEKDTNGLYVCPYNQECRCEHPKCGSCGWNPEVAERRLKKIEEAIKDERYHMGK